MKRHEFEHVIAAAANVLGHDVFVVIGSQAILGAVPDPPEELLVSMEADLYPLLDPARAIDVEGALGDGSQFALAFGYYAHGVGPETAKAPLGWQDRLVRVDIPPRVGSARAPVALCLEPHDLVLAKLVRGGARDIDYAVTAVQAGLVDVAVLRRRVADLPVDPVIVEIVGARVSVLAGPAADRPDADRRA